MYTKIILLLLLIFTCVSCVSPIQTMVAPEEPPKITIIYSGNLNGELEPCGCTKVGDLGGIRRRATMVQRLRQQNPGLFLISSGGLLAINSADDRIMNKYILKGIDKLDYDAIGVQKRDLTFGPQLLLGESLPWVASNRSDDRFKASRPVSRQNITLHFFSWLRPDSKQLQQMQGTQTNPQQSMAMMLKDIEQAKGKGHLVVLLTSQSLKEINKTIPLDHIDILLIKSAYEVYGQAQKMGKTLILQPGSRGMRLGHVDLVYEKNEIKTFKHKVIELPTSIPEATNYASWYDAYNAELKRNYLKHVEVRKATETGKSPYAGAEKCKTCHQAAYQSWQKSQHAHAYASLEKVNKSYDPNCIGCHTVGFEKSGGFIDELVTEQLMNVQCESCHGASNNHVASNGKKPVVNKDWSKEKMCKQCHVGSHSPLFKVDQYWPRLSH